MRSLEKGPGTIVQTPQDIANKALELRTVFLGLTSSIPAMLSPDLPIFRYLCSVVQPRSPFTSASDYPSNLRHGDSDPEALVFSTRDVFTRLAEIKHETMWEDLLPAAMLLGTVRVGDMILDANNYEQISGDPMIQFVRHFRNACAHGDRWSFHQGQPDKPAVFRGVALSNSLNGQRATFETVTPRLYVELLEEIANYFVPNSTSPTGASPVAPRP